jgi:hypothetical protein
VESKTGSGKNNSLKLGTRPEETVLQNLPVIASDQGERGNPLNFDTLRDCFGMLRQPRNDVRGISLPAMTIWVFCKVLSLCSLRDIDLFFLFYLDIIRGTLNNSVF